MSLPTLQAGAAELQAPAEARAGEAATPDAVRQRLDYLFRRSLNEGRIHPLFHLLLQYRRTVP